MRMCVGWVVLVLMGCGVVEGQRPSLPPPVVQRALPTLDTNPGYFASCSEIQTWVEATRSEREWEWGRYARWIEETYGSGERGSEVPMMSDQVGRLADGNWQEASVAEADIVQVHSRLLFVARSASVEVVKKPSLRLVQTLPFPELTRIRVLLFGNRLLVTGELSRDGRPETQARIFAVRGDSLTEERRYSFSGALIGARMKQGRVVLITSTSLDQTSQQVASQLEGLACSQIQRPLLNDFNLTLTAVHQVNLADSALQTTFVGRMGRVDHVYVSEENIFMVTQGYEWLGWDVRLAEHDVFSSLVVAKFEVFQPEPSMYLGAAQVSGVAQSEWSMKEDAKSGRFYIVTSEREGGRARGHHIWALSSNASSFDLQLVGRSEEFGFNEDIRAVRFVDDKAYVVTFEKVDPLFVFDLRGPAPILRGSLKVPGFSAYLHPVGTSKLLGLGYTGAAGGVQLSLFDVSQDVQVKVLEQIELGGRGSHVQPSADHQAFYLDGCLAVVPVQILKEKNDFTSVSPADQIEFSGALVMKVKGSLGIRARLSHQNQIPPECRRPLTRYWCGSEGQVFDISRVVKWGNRIAAISRFGVTVHDSDGKGEPKDSLWFEDAANECTRLLRCEPQALVRGG